MMEAVKLLTVDDLFRAKDEGAELIDGEVVRRPMARSEHSLVQLALSDEVQVLKRRGGPGGWWIMSEISVQYSEHQCPSHDLAGWRKERVPKRPSGIMALPPDWVCEILSPEDRSLIVYELDGGGYRLRYSVAYRPAGDPGPGAHPALRVDRNRPPLRLRRAPVIGRGD